MEQERRVKGRVISIDPLVTYSQREASAPLGIASARPDAFSGRRALHLVGLSQTIETDNRHAKVARDLQAADAELPQSRFVILTNTEFEAYLLSTLRVAAMPCNDITFIDDGAFRPTETRAEFDAVCDTTAIPRERLDLARDAGNVDFSELAQLHGAARAALVGRASVGLWLGGAEHCAIEYLLCGLPVVSTPIAGSAQRYLLPPFCRIVPDDPAAIAAAVQGFARARVPKPVVRGAMMHALRFDRHNFLIAINKLAKETFGRGPVFDSFAPFEGGLPEPRPLDEALAGLAT